MKALALTLALMPIMDREGHHSNWYDFGCPNPLYCEDFTGLPAYADAAETFSDNVILPPNWAPYRIGPEFPILLYSVL